MLRQIIFVILLVTTAVPIVPPAAAHWDGAIEAQEVTVAPGDTASVGFEAHYHRLVGSIASVGTELPIQVAYVRTGSDQPIYPLLDAPSGRFHALIECCKDETWAPHELLLYNPHDVPVHVRIEARLIHDDLAVIAHDAEPGAAIQTTLLIGIIAALLTVRGHRRLAIERPLADIQRRLRRSQIVWGAMAAVAGLAIAIGMFRHGGGPLAGAVATAALLPPVPYMANASLMVGILIILWFVSLNECTQAVGRAPGAGRAPVVWGGILATGVLFSMALVAWQYGRVLWPSVVASGVAAPVLYLVVRVQMDRAAIHPEDAALETPPA